MLSHVDWSRMIRTILFNWCIQVINIATSILAARLLGPDGRGQLAIVLLYPQLIANMGLLGMDRGLSILTGKNLIKHNLWSILSVCLVLSLGAFIIFYPLAYGQIRDTNIFKLSISYAAYMPFFFVFMLISASFQGGGHFAQYNKGRISFYFAYLGLLIVFWLFNYATLSGFVLANLFAVVIASFYSLFLYIKLYGFHVLTFRPILRDVFTLIKNSWMFVGPMIIVILASQIDKIIINNNLDEKILGLYVVYLAFSRLGGAISNAFNVHMFHESIQNNIARIYQRIIRTGGIYLIMSLILIIFAKPVIRIVYGVEYIAELYSLYIIIIGSFFYILNEILSEYFRGKQIVRVDMIGGVIYIVILSTPYLITNPQGNLQSFAVFVVCAEVIKFLFYVWSLKLYENSTTERYSEV